jgi:hypothetical protein
MRSSWAKPSCRGKKVLEDFQRGHVQRVYRTDQAHNLAGLPTPRYDLIEPAFVVPHVVQATRGCPYRCKFCATATINPGFRTRPLDDVIRDIATPRFSGWLQNKLDAALARWLRGWGTLRPGALILATALNGHYGLNRLTGNVPVRFREAHSPSEPLPARTFFTAQRVLA